MKPAGQREKSAKNRELRRSRLTGLPFAGGHRNAAPPPLFLSSNRPSGQIDAVSGLGGTRPEPLENLRKREYQRAADHVEPEKAEVADHKTADDDGL